MRHRVKTKKLGRPVGHRKALKHNLVQSLFEHGRITTTLTRAKAIQADVDKIITKGKKQTLASRRALVQYFPTRSMALKVDAELATRFSDRQSGYTRILKLGARSVDMAQMGIIEFVDYVDPSLQKSKRRRKSAEKAAQKEDKVDAKTQEKQAEKVEKKSRSTKKSDDKAAKHEVAQ